MSVVGDSLKQIRSYPSAVVGLVLVASMFVISGIVMVTIPYSQAIKLWRGEEGVWNESPENAAPAWLQWFQSRKLPLTIIRDTQQDGKTVTDSGDGTKTVKASLKFDFPYDEPPSEVALWLHAKYKDAQPFVQLKWKRPDGEVIEFEDRTPGSTDRYQISRDQSLRTKLHAQSIEDALFTKKGEIVRGAYELIIDGVVFEPDSDFDARLVVYGKLQGWAGTDNERRGLGFALLWGVPFALAFGLLAAVGTTLFALVISAIGTWYGGTLDAVIQRITEVNAMLPSLVFLIMIGMFFSTNIWVILISVILLNMFGLGIKTYRSIFLSLKEAPYIEAARAYGASDMRIIFRYLIPRVIPMLIPAFVTGVPSFVFLETTLNILGVGDPNAITWGRLLHEAYTNDALYKGHYYWVLEPATCLLITGMSFAMIGFALDRIFNPRLRNI